MVTLALVGAPAAPMSYAAFNALAAKATAAGASAAAAGSAAAAAIAAGAAAALGAGIGGFLLGQMILDGLEQPQVLPDMGEYLEAGAAGQTVRLFYEYKVNGQTIFDNQPSQLLDAPIKGAFYRVINGAATWFVFDRNGMQQNIVSTGNTSSGTQFRIISVQLIGGQTVAPTKKLPTYVPVNPDRPQPRPVTPLPIPGFPDFPITPQVVPNPGNDEPSEGEKRPPGVIVQIPQTGQQFDFTPSGVIISNYNAPNREPFRVPPLVLPPGSVAATPPCCEGSEVDLSEIICRLKALENGLLDDGYDFTVNSTPDSRSGRVFDSGKIFDVVRIFVTSKPSNLPVQTSNAPAPDVWFVGWFSWLAGGKEGERIPLHFQESGFIAPEGVDGFTYQLGYGSTGFASYSTKVKKDYVDAC